MCGRFETKKIEKSVIELFKSHNLNIEVDKDIEDRADEDIRPTQKIMSVLLKNDIYKITKVNWGIKFKEDSPLIFNSRIETIKEKKYWATLFDKNRCLIPMSGFYEWRKEGTRKQKYRIYLPDNDLYFVPALYFTDKEKNICASLITTVPNEFIKPIHHRMPIILDFDKAVSYLSNTAQQNLELCIPYDDTKPMEMELADK